MPARARFLYPVARILPVLVATIFATAAVAQESATATPPPFQWTKTAPTLLPDVPLFEGLDLPTDWCDTRRALSGRGITFDLSTTQFYQGLTQGGLQQQFQYGGRNDYFMTLNGEKAGLWNGASMTVHGETRYGESANTLTGALAPVNLMLSVPLASGTVSGLTGVKFTQVLSERMRVYAGKLNTLDDFRQPLTSAGPLAGFQNSAMIYNPVFARTVPYSTFGAGCAYISESERAFEITVYDTNNTPTVSGFNTLFNNGATVYAQGTLPTRFFGQSGHCGISGTYSTGTYSDLTPTAYLDPTNGLALQSTPVTGSWCLTCNFDQALYVSPDDPQRKWGVFGNLGVADQNPNPVPWFANIGLGGASPIAGRNADSFGIAYFYIGVSDSLKSSARPLASLRDEYGIELYYNVAVAPRFHLSPDIQVISPFRDRADPSLLVGLRAKIDF